MNPTERRYPIEEVARRGDKWQAKIEPTLPPDALHQYLAIDIEGGEYEVDASDVAAVTRLHARVADAQVWLARVGHKAAWKRGGRSLPWVAQR